MVPMRVQKRKEAFHEPCPLNPSFSPSGGEGARRAVEGDCDRFMASIHVRILEVSPSHEPGRTSNIEHPTPNIEWQANDRAFALHSIADVRYDDGMTLLAIREFHQRLNARFTELNGMEVVEHYGDPAGEHAALREAAGVLDLSFRSRLCLTGADRQKFLNGQVTNNVKDLKTGQGCYAALVNAKGRMQSDLNIYILADEILLDFEPGYGAKVAQRLEKYIIADDVQVVDVAAHYGLISVQGPEASEVIRALGLERPAGKPAADPSREGNRRTAGATPLPAFGTAAAGFVQLPTKPANFVSFKAPTL